MADWFDSRIVKKDTPLGCLLFCERAVERCVNGTKKDDSVCNLLFNKLEFVSIY